MNKNHLKLQKGFTQIELLVVIGLVVILGSIGALFGFDAVSRSTVNSQRDLVVTLLSGTRAKALANVNENAHGLRIGTDYITLFEGDTFAGSDPASHIEIEKNSNVAVTGLTDIVFKQLSGRTDTTGTVTLSDGTGSATIDINDEGLIDW